MILQGLEVGLIDSPLLASVPLLAVILLLGIVKSIMLLPALVLKLNIEQWVCSFLRGLGLDVPNRM